MKKIFIGILILGSMYLLGSPYLKVKQIQSAVADGDADTLITSVDFYSLEKGLEASVELVLLEGEKMLVEDVWVSTGIAVTKMLIGEELFDAGAEIYEDAKADVVDEMVGQMISPNNLLNILDSGVLLSFFGDDDFENASNSQDGLGITKLEVPGPSVRYDGFNKFVVTFATDLCSESHLTLERRGLDWVLTGMSFAGTECWR